jgi:hypothetical protein
MLAGLYRPFALIVLGLSLALGCQPAGRYGPNPPRSTRTNTGTATPPGSTEAKPPPLPDDYLWMEPKPADMEPPIPLVFVHEGTKRDEWNKLPGFWTEVPLPAEQAAALLSMSPFHLAGLSVQHARQVKIKVPLGLDDPMPRLPAYNPPTVGRWELGKQLFFDKDHLLPPTSNGDKLACATCHDPAKGYTDGKPMALGGNLNTPTIINAVYGTAFFWDGRAGALEEVVQRSLEDERETPGATPLQRHNWSGVVQRLRDRPEYVARFKKVFGTPPTQDAVGKSGRRARARRPKRRTTKSSSTTRLSSSSWLPTSCPARRRSPSSLWRATPSSAPMARPSACAAMVGPTSPTTVFTTWASIQPASGRPLAKRPADSPRCRPV